MKKLAVVIFAALLTASVFAGCDKKDTPPKETRSAVHTDAAPSEVTTEAPAVTTEAPTANIGIGGSRPNYFTKEYHFVYTSIPGELIDQVGDDNFQKWLEEDLNYNPGAVGKIDSKPLYIYDFIKHFNISKEDFIAADKVAGGKYRQFTDGMIDALYSDDQSEINRYFVSPFSFLVGNTIYTPEWICNHSHEEVNAVGISDQAIADKMGMWKADFTAEQFEQLKEFCESNSISYTLDVDENTLGDSVDPNTSRITPPATGTDTAPSEDTES